MFARRLSFFAAGVICLLTAPRPVAVQAVPDVSTLRAQTPDEVAQARYFDIQGRKLEPGTTLVLGGEAAPGAPPEYEAFLTRAACSNDLVVVGRPVSARVLFSASETSLFTDFQFAVEQWIRPPSAVGLTRPGASTALTVSVWGGRATVVQGTFTVIGGFKLDIGRLYALFLRKISGTASYRPSNPLGFAVDGATAEPLSRGVRVPAEMDRSGRAVSPFLTDLRKAAAGCAGARQS